MSDSITVIQPAGSSEPSPVSVAAPASQQEEQLSAPIEKQEVESETVTPASVVEESNAPVQTSVSSEQPVVKKVDSIRTQPVTENKPVPVVVKTTKPEVVEAVRPVSQAKPIEVPRIEVIAADTATKDSVTAVDSLAKDSVAPVVAVQTFQQRDIPSKDGSPRVPTVSMSLWYTPFLLVLFIVYMYVLGARMKAFKTEVLTFFNPAAGGSIFGSEWLQSSPYKFALTCASLCSLGLFGFFATHGSNCTLHPLLIIVAVIATVIVCLLKKWLMDLLQFVYYPGRTTLFSNSFMTIIRLAGLCMVPAVLMLSYSPDSCFNGALYFGFGVLFLAKILMIGKSIVNFFDGFISIFYLFLYLCTFEVLPLVGLSAFLVNIKYIF